MDTQTHPASSTPPTTPRVTPSRQRHAGHIVAIVIGCLMIMPGLGILAGGVVAASAQAFATDDGYFHFTPDRIESDGVAVAATDLWLDGNADDDAPDWLLDSLDVDLRLRVVGAPSTDEVFVGIARAADVETFLSGAAYADVVEMDGRTPRYVDVDGTDAVGAPVEQDFWTVSAHGAGEQEITWDARGGTWSVSQTWLPVT